MQIVINLVPFAVAATLLVFSVARPWLALVVLLAMLPLNGFVTLVLGDLLGLSGLPRLALAAWHDALLGGIVIAAAAETVADARRRGRAVLGRIDVLAVAVLALGAVYILVAHYRLTALYAYRTLYEPIILGLAIVHLARIRGLPEWLPGRAALAMVAGGVAAAVAAWPQVYLGGFEYLDHFYHEVGERLSPSYIATAIHQPRAVGTFNSPNEFGAFMALTVGLLLAPGVMRVRSTVRLWLLVAVGLALFLSFSRSGWLTTLVVGAGIVWLLRDRLPTRGGLVARITDRRALIAHLAPAVVGGALFIWAASGSGAAQFVRSTVTGDDPSISYRPGSAQQGIAEIRANPFGVGLGMAGPKSVRFGEVGDEPVLASETWYIAYAMQVGIAGLLLLVALVLAVAGRLWRVRHERWPALSLAIGAGLAVGALFIPIIDDPAVATPLWAILGIGLACAAVKPVAETQVATRAGTANAGALI